MFPFSQLFLASWSQKQATYSCFNIVNLQIRHLSELTIFKWNIIIPAIYFKFYWKLHILFHLALLFWTNDSDALQFQNALLKANPLDCSSWYPRCRWINSLWSQSTSMMCFDLVIVVLDILYVDSCIPDEFYRLAWCVLT